MIFRTNVTRGVIESTRRYRISVNYLKQLIQNLTFRAKALRRDVSGQQVLTSRTSAFAQDVKFSLFQVHSKKRTTCSGLMKTALNNVVLPTLFNVVNNIVQHC